MSYGKRSRSTACLTPPLTVLACCSLFAGCATDARLAFPAGASPDTSSEVLRAAEYSSDESPLPPEAVPAEPRIHSLERVLAIAARHNLTFAEFSANRDKARAAVLEALAYPNPEIEMSATRVTTREEPIERAVEYELGLTQSVEWPHKRRHRREAAEAGVSVSEWEEQAFRVTLRAEVAKAYHHVVFQDQAVQLAQVGAELGDEIQALVQRRLDAGEIAEIDLIKARIETLKARRRVQMERRRLNSARIALDTLCGGALPADFALEPELPAEVAPLDAETSHARALSDHPALLRLEALIVQQEAVIVRERSAWHPDLQPGLALGQEADADTFSVSLGVEVPIWNRNRGGIATAEAELARLRAEHERLQLEIGNSLRSSAELYADSAAQLMAFDAPLREGAVEALQIETLLYEQGEHDLLQLLDARRTAQEIEAEYLQAAYDTAVAQVEFEQAMGKGGDLR